LTTRATAASPLSWPAPGTTTSAARTEKEDRTIRFWELETGKPRGVLVLLEDGEWLAVSPEGHYTGSPKATEGFEYKVKDESDGKVGTRTPAEFAREFPDWKSDPSKVRLVAK
jgi:hypothetical protein